MKRIYLSILSLALVVGANAQQSKMLTTKHDLNQGTSSRHSIAAPVANTEKMAVLWSDDFSAPANWVMSNTSAPISWNWTITTNQADIPNAAPSLQPFMSTTAANGFALINSDGQPGNADGDGAIVAEITTATAIDLSASPNVILQFQHSYRWWQEDRGVRVSGDNGATWTEYPVTSLVGGAIANGYPNLQNSENPVMETVNISAVAGGQSQVLVQFYYNDNDIWAWYWTVDDVAILEQPANDIQLLSGWFVGTNNEGVEYGRTPLDHVDASYIVGAEVYNFGFNDQTNVVFGADFVSFTSGGTDPLLESDSTTYIEQTESPALGIGLYSGTYAVVSDLETGGAEFGNNVYERNFEVTDKLYSQDGIGVHPVSELNTTAIGTGSFAGGEDGLVMASLYYLKVADDVTSIVVMLDPATVPGGEIYGSLKDTTTFINNDMTSLFITNTVTVSATDISNGYATLTFPINSTVAPGAYYAAVELYSNANTNDVWIMDDLTITQPFWASAIYIPGEQSYTNGEAFGIRLTVAGADAGINENSLAGVTVYPNPSLGIINITNENGTSNTIEIHNMLGQEILTKVANAATTVDLSANGAGVYLVKVSNENGSVTERVVIK